MATVIGPIDWGGRQLENGHRQYSITFLVRVTPGEGPYQVLTCPGLPLPGSLWAFFSDIDVWAWCRLEADVDRYEPQGGEKDRFFTIKQNFSTEPGRRCTDTAAEDPLLEPPKISGSVAKYTEEAVYDRIGRPIRNSAHEQIRGQQVEFDSSRSKVRIEMNVATFDQVRLAVMMLDTVNVATLWGFPRRCVKLSDVSWQDRYHGQCYKYYALSMEFDTNLKTFDRDVLDEGSKVIQGHWGEGAGTGGAVWVLDNIAGTDPDPDNPNHFMRAQDRPGNLTRLILNGRGYPADSALGVAITFAEAADHGGPYQIVEITFTTSTAHGVEPGATVNVKGVNPPQYNGEYDVTAIDSATVFRVERLGTTANFPAYDTGQSGGYMTLNGDLSSTGPGNIHVEKYPENNFLLLGIPVLL